jgi:CheY-like chemotaxis protein
MSTPSSPIPAQGLVLSDDLIFTSRITGTGRDLGFTLRSACSTEALRALLLTELPRCLIVDLSNPGLKIADFMQRLREVCAPMPRVVAYGSHVDTATLQAARAAGCDPVLPRSKFVEELVTALPEWMTS